jgi:hypothetical protein
MKKTNILRLEKSEREKIMQPNQTVTYLLVTYCLVSCKKVLFL